MEPKWKLAMMIFGLLAGLGIAGGVIGWACSTLKSQLETGQRPRTALDMIEDKVAGLDETPGEAKKWSEGWFSGYKARQTEPGRGDPLHSFDPHTGEHLLDCDQCWEAAVDDAKARALLTSDPVQEEPKLVFREGVDIKWVSIKDETSDTIRVSLHGAIWIVETRDGTVAFAWDPQEECLEVQAPPEDLTFCYEPAAWGMVAAR